MGMRSHALAVAAGAALVVYASPQIRHEIIDKIDSINHTLAELLKEYGSSPSRPVAQEGVLRPLQQPYLDEQPRLQRTDGTTMQPWNYRGNTWPKEWAIVNEDGSCNRDYVRWYEGRNR
ncbi:Uncharacterised protein [uncultured archaeon]|nr:Uncharacterised protein [uncultured archaeon]